MNDNPNMAKDGVNGDGSVSAQDSTTNVANAEPTSESKASNEINDSKEVSTNDNTTTDTALPPPTTDTSIQNGTEVKPEEKIVVPPAPVKLAVPSLRGNLGIEGSIHRCRGVWALSDDLHGKYTSIHYYINEVL